MRSLILVVFLVAPVWAQDKPAELPRELALEIELQRTKEALMQARADLARALNERLALEAQLVTLQLQSARGALVEKAVKALGGVPACDGFDLERAMLIKGECPRQEKK